MRYLNVFSVIVILSVLFACSDSKTIAPTVADLYAGEWAEKTAERVVAKLVPDGDSLRVEIGWREEGLAQYEVWTMTAASNGSDTLTYHDGLYMRRWYEHEGDTACTEEVKYRDGKGRFYINGDGDLVWDERINNQDETTVFIRANFGE